MYAHTVLVKLFFGILIQDYMFWGMVYGPQPMSVF